MATIAVSLTFQNGMKLLGSTTSPYVRKVRVVLAEKKLEYTFEQENPWAPSPELAGHNPLGKVPCLLFAKVGMVLYDSRVIVEYLDTLSPVCRLIPTNGRDRLEVKIWEALADGVLDAGVLARLEQTWEGRERLQRSPAWVAHQLEKVHAGLAEMSRMLGDKPYCTGVQFSLADVAVGCTLGWLDFRFPQIEWRGRYPNLAELHEKLLQRPGFADTLPG